MIIDDMWSSVLSWWSTAVFLVPHQDSVYLTSRVGSVLHIPARVLVSQLGNKVIAYGTQAREVEYAGTQRIQVFSPVSFWGISHETGARLLLRALFSAVLGRRFIFQPSAHVVVTSSITPFMRQLWQRALYSAGARSVTIWHPALAAAAAAQLPYSTPHGFAIGWGDEREIVVSLLAFGQVQHEVRRSRRWQSTAEPTPEEVAEVWATFLKSVPIDFVATLQTDGLIFLCNEPPQGQSRHWARALESPVTFLPWSSLALGLRTLAGQQEGQYGA